jgi:peroxiredoxin
VAVARCLKHCVVASHCRRSKRSTNRAVRCVPPTWQGHRSLTSYYKKINELGARLIFLTPKPLETTRRVAEFFEVEFEFWLDESLTATRQLGLLLEDGVPSSYEKEYGDDTMWPASLVIGADGIIRFVELSKHVVDRPNPKTLLNELEKVISA